MVTGLVMWNIHAFYIHCDTCTHSINQWSWSSLGHIHLVHPAAVPANLSLSSSQHAHCAHLVDSCDKGGVKLGRPLGKRSHQCLGPGVIEENLVGEEQPPAVDQVLVVRLVELEIGGDI